MATATERRGAVRGHQPWICKKAECGTHGRCLEQQAVRAPRVIKERVLWCWCHNCEQTRRQSGRGRNRWTDDA